MQCGCDAVELESGFYNPRIRYADKNVKSGGRVDINDIHLVF